MMKKTAPKLLMHTSLQRRKLEYPILHTRKRDKIVRAIGGKKRFCRAMVNFGSETLPRVTKGRTVQRKIQIFACRLL